MRRLLAGFAVALFCVGSFILAQAGGDQNVIGGGIYGTYKPSGGSGCSQATALLARMDGSQNTSAVTTAVCGMVTDGTYSLLDALYVFAINSTANANLNWAQNAYNLTKVGTVTFSANAGYTGDGSTGYFTTGFIPSSAGGNFTQNSASMGACILSTGTGGNIAEVGTSSLSVYSLINPDSTSLYMDLSDATFSAYSISSVQGSWIVTRASSSALTYYKNATSVATPSSTSGSVSDMAFYVLAYNSGGTATAFSSHQDAYIFWGGALTGTQVTAIYNRLHTYLGTVSAPSGC